MSRQADAPAAQSDVQPAPEVNGISTVKKIVRSVAIILVLQFIFTRAGQYIKAPLKPDVAKPDFAKTTHEETEVDYSIHPRQVIPMWKPPTVLDMDIYITETKDFDLRGKTPFVSERGLLAGNWSDLRQVDTKIDLLQYPGVLKNGSLYAHVYSYRSRDSPRIPTDPVLPDDMALHSTHELTKFMPRRRDTAVKKLIGGTDVTETKSRNEVVAFYHANFTLSLVGDAGVIPLDSIHPVVRPYIVLEPTNARDETGKDGYYFPIIFENKFWQLQEHMFPINATVTTLPFYFSVTHVGLMKMQVFAALDQAAKQQAQAVGGSGAEFEEVKRIFLETNVYLLVATFAVSCLHSIFEMLAFKNDIAHFRTKKDNTGVSLNAILMNVFMQSIILLYLLDNSEQASYVILFGQGFGIAVEAWKITKSVDVKLVRVQSVIPYRIRFEEKRKLSETEQATKNYDEIATRWLLISSIPLLALYAIYSILYEEHKGWWSFTINTAVGFVYFYGFLTMIPSLYINYRLKSVAHMSTRAMTYKFLNTIVDDFAAMVIKQPILSRIAAFRDDVVFVVYIYQYYIYRVDKTRANEFGSALDYKKEQ